MALLERIGVRGGKIINPQYVRERMNPQNILLRLSSRRLDQLERVHQELQTITKPNVADPEVQQQAQEDAAKVKSQSRVKTVEGALELAAAATVIVVFGPGAVIPAAATAVLATEGGRNLIGGIRRIKNRKQFGVDNPSLSPEEQAARHFAEVRSRERRQIKTRIKHLVADASYAATLFRGFEDRATKIKDKAKALEIPTRKGTKAQKGGNGVVEVDSD